MLKAATGSTTCGNGVVKVHCDNKGVLCHGNNENMKLKDNQSQADGLRSMNRLTRENTVETEYVWAEEHSVEKKGKEKCTLEQLQNDEVGEVSKEAVKYGLQTKQFSSSNLLSK